MVSRHKNSKATSWSTHWSLRPSPIYEVGVGCAHPSHTVFWTGTPILVIVVNYFCICPAVTTVLNGEVFVIHVARELRAFDHCRVWIWSAVRARKTTKLDVEKSQSFFLFLHKTSQGIQFGKEFCREKTMSQVNELDYKSKKKNIQKLALLWRLFC